MALSGNALLSNRVRASDADRDHQHLPTLAHALSKRAGGDPEVILCVPVVISNRDTENTKIESLLGGALHLVNSFARNLLRFIHQTLTCFADVFVFESGCRQHESNGGSSRYSNSADR